MPSSPMSQARGMRYRAPTILQIRPTTLRTVMPLRMDFCVLLKKRPPKKRKFVGGIWQNRGKPIISALPRFRKVMMCVGGQCYCSI